MVSAVITTTIHGSETTLDSWQLQLYIYTDTLIYYIYIILIYKLQTIDKLQGSF